MWIRTRGRTAELAYEGCRELVPVVGEVPPEDGVLGEGVEVVGDARDAGDDVADAVLDLLLQGGEACEHGAEALLVLEGLLLGLLLVVIGALLQQLLDLLEGPLGGLLQLPLLGI